MKEYLSVRGIEFESVNVLADDASLERLRALGARSVPVVARDGRFVYAQVIRDVVEFLGLQDATGPELAPPVLAERMDRVLATAIRLCRQMPDAAHGNLLPNRPRSWRELAHHVFQVPTAFLAAEEEARSLEADMLAVGPPESMVTSEAVAVHGEAVRARFARWRSAKHDFDARVPTYFGLTSRHELLERTVWHTAQHVRQLTALLESIGIAPDRPLGAHELAGLPLTERIWDDA